MSINDEKLKRKKNIVDSLTWLIDNDQWDEVKEIMVFCVVKASDDLIKKVKDSKGYKYPDELSEVIKLISDMDY